MMHRALRPAPGGHCLWKPKIRCPLLCTFKKLQGECIRLRRHCESRRECTPGQDQSFIVNDIRGVGRGASPSQSLRRRLAKSLPIRGGEPAELVEAIGERNLR